MSIVSYPLVPLASACYLSSLLSTRICPRICWFESIIYTPWDLLGRRNEKRANRGWAKKMEYLASLPSDRSKYEFAKYEYERVSNSYRPINYARLTRFDISFGSVGVREEWNFDSVCRANSNYHPRGSPSFPLYILYFTQLSDTRANLRFPVTFHPFSFSRRYRAAFKYRACSKDC